ncbi:archease [Methanosarcinales archaeon]|uniref:Archease n=1 Tax=Candidatus Syntropharchaeum caldarium TaxID=1838285 RepID=A0A1F2P9Z5_9EURY|nr:MAG: archease [Candidatus Syntrophoarchaeum caldarius]RLG35952.1 MAG: archease [Methanosarcinales archaeon]
MGDEEGFEFLDHISDAKFRAWGRTLEEAFISAGRALFALMVDTGNIERDLEVKLHLEAESPEWLLFEWLSELLYQFEVEELIFTAFDLTIKKEGDLYILDATCYGARYDPAKVAIEHYVKAITLHDLRIVYEEERVSVEVVVDV